MILAVLLVAAALRPIGRIETIFPSKFGTPRQGGLAPDARATLRLDPDAVGGDAVGALDGLSQYSHVWLIWGFHLHGDAQTRAKVSPPVLRGRKVGVFATRAPYRPNPFGLTLVRLDRVDGGTLHLSGVDLVSGSPVYDIKPYLAEWDAPRDPALVGQTAATTCTALRALLLYCRRCLAPAPCYNGTVARWRCAERCLCPARNNAY